jgi:phenylacetate-CoA ligase
MKEFYKNPLYCAAPVYGQNAYVTLKALVYDKIRKCKRSLDFLDELRFNEYLTEEQFRSIQLQKLRKIVNVAGMSVPWYRNVFKKIGFDCNAPFSFEEYANLPFLEKTEVIKNYEQFLPDRNNRNISVKSQSSGTTGMSLYVLRDRTAIGGEWAFAQRQFRWAGIPSNGRMALLRDDEVVPMERRKQPYWRYAWMNNELWLSSFHLSEKTAGAYLEELKKFKPEGVFSYPSTIYWLSVFVRKAGLNARLPSLKGIVVSSEMLYEFQAKSIQEVFQVPIFDWYGSAERVNFIGTCEKGSRHLFPDYGYEEYIALRDEPDQLELVGTGFLNTAMPLLRYRSGDLVVRSNNACSCGRCFPVIKKIYGRNNDSIITPDGRRITVLEIFNNISSIEQIQIVQESKTKIVINVVPKRSFNVLDKKEILVNLHKILGFEMEFNFKIIDRIPGGPHGKFRMIVSKI